ncbi:hypothetical protein [Mucilaginibacter pocheonensis]|uniref:Uncharacterized protein n=1 Tax=Mucilaginibacter pocheonensis TaxID=398050 RepID=A0ABU1T8E2_9SPHI|nr:hypothetical protein [Mucilaginibacter pocheonensis]MDR6941677.1 hypothetical protein [Mucilaginibacter pocheonensis]
MKTSNVPGYKDLFPEGNERYCDLISGLAPEMIVRICSAINNELNGPGGMAGNQVNILRDFAQTFTREERRDLLSRIAAYQENVGDDVTVILFATRYLLTMVL